LTRGIAALGLKVDDCTLLPLTEYQKSSALFSQLGELLREAGIPERDLPPARRSVPRLGTDPAHGPAPKFLGVRPSQQADRGLGRARADQNPPPSAFGSAWNRSRFPRPAIPIVSTSAGKIWRNEPPRLHSLASKELEIGLSHSLHIATRPSMAFHGNMQVAIAEARTLVEQGQRVAFFAFLQVR